MSGIFYLPFLVSEHFLLLLLLSISSPQVHPMLWSEYVIIDYIISNKLHTEYLLNRK